jgi:hypothetical protein
MEGNVFRCTHCHKGYLSLDGRTPCGSQRDAEGCTSYLEYRRAELSKVELKAEPRTTTVYLDLNNKEHVTAHGARVASGIKLLRDYAGSVFVNTTDGHMATLFQENVARRTIAILSAVLHNPEK